MFGSRRSVWICVTSLLWLSAVGGPAVGQWLQFRGPQGQGKAGTANLPTLWSESENVAWKTAIPGLGWSSPVVDSRQIWLTTATADGRSLRAIAVDTSSGKLLHDVEVFHIDQPESINPKNTYASPTPVLDEEHVYVHFGTYGTACLDRETASIVWTNQELKLEHKEGPGSSPVLWKDRLIIPCDGMDVQFVAALDKATGKLLWKTNRTGTLDPNPDFRKAYSTPLVLEVNSRVEAICVGADQVISYDPMTGSELWKVRYKGFSNVPVPVLGEGAVFICTNYARPTLLAIKLGGQGDVTDTHVLWEATRQVSAIPSALYLDGRVYMVSNGGVLSCLDAKSGDSLWQKRLGGKYAASPVFAGGNIFLCSESGETTVLQPPDQIISTNALEGEILATPAIFEDSLFIRTNSHLYRIGSARVSP